MNYKIIIKILGRILFLEGLLLIFPLIVSLIYHENTYLSFIIPICFLLVTGLLLSFIKPEKKTFYAKEGFVVVGLSWILLSVFGAFPFFISREIPSYINALFETVSGFTTTGATILENVEGLSKGMNFWRCLTHWIGGMGVLVFILAILPSSDGQNIHLLKAESTGPQVGKLVSKVRFTARILYLIYLALTIVEAIMLLCGGLSIYDSLTTSFATAGTGGFGIYNDSVASFNTYSQIVIGVFMLIFGINFNIFYLILIGKFKQAIKSEELRWYVSIVFISVVLICMNLIFSLDYTFSDALLHSFFQVSSIITTTGFSSVDFNLWPSFSKSVLFILMYVGACAGSTGGGLKVSRLVILLKSLKREINKLIHPYSVSHIKFEGVAVDEDVVKGVNGYFVTLVVLSAFFCLLISVDGKDFTTNISAVAACINNIGPGFNEVGPLGNFDLFSPFSKIVLSFAMLIGRLEIYPILILFIPKVFTKR